MANFDDRVRRTAVSVRDFGGLNRSAPLCGSEGCFELINLRPMADGSLKRREGVRLLWSFDAPVRCVYSAERGAHSELYIVAGEQAYVSVDRGMPVLIGALEGVGEKMRFSCLDGDVILFGESGAWLMSPEAATPVQPYIPLYGKDWEAIGGERSMYELPNLLCDRVRVSFLLHQGESRMTLEGLPSMSVEGVYIEGVLLEAQHYEVAYGEITMDRSYPEGTRADVVFRLPEEPSGMRALLGGAAQLAVIGEVERARVMFFGGSLPGGRAYVSRPVSEDERGMMRVMFPRSSPILYVTEEDVMMVGDGIAPITGACRHYDRSLIYTPSGAWMMEHARLDEGSLEVVPVNSTLGCSVAGGCGVLGNEPYTVCGRRVLRWNSRTDEHDECNAAAISYEVEPLLPPAFGAQACVMAHPWRGEVYFYLPEAGDFIYVFSERRGLWTRFTGFRPRGMFVMGEQVGFYSGQAVFVLDEGRLTDESELARDIPILAQYAGQYLDFGLAGRQRRVYGVGVMAACRSLMLTLQDARGRSQIIALDGQEVPAVLETRGRGGRFRFLRVGVRCEDGGPFELYGLHLAVGP